MRAGRVWEVGQHGAGVRRYPRGKLLGPALPGELTPINRAAAWDEFGPLGHLDNRRLTSYESD